MMEVRRRTMLQDQMAIMHSSSNLRNLLRLRDEEDRTQEQTLDTLGSILFGDKQVPLSSSPSLRPVLHCRNGDRKKPISSSAAAAAVSRTLLDIMREEGAVSLRSQHKWKGESISPLPKSVATSIYRSSISSILAEEGDSYSFLLQTTNDNSPDLDFRVSPPKFLRSELSCATSPIDHRRQFSHSGKNFEILVPPPSALLRNFFSCLPLSKGVANGSVGNLLPGSHSPVEKLDGARKLKKTEPLRSVGCYFFKSPPPTRVPTPR